MDSSSPMNTLILTSLVLTLALLTKPVSTQTAYVLFAPQQIDETERSVTIGFSASSPRADEYVVEYRMYGSHHQKYQRGIREPDTNEEWYTVTQLGLSPQNTYILRVAIYKEGQRSGASDAIVVRTLGWALTEITPSLINVSQHSVTVEFNASIPRAYKYLVEARVPSRSRFYRSVVITDTQKEIYTTSMSQLYPATTYNILVIPKASWSAYTSYLNSLYSGAPDPLQVTTLSSIKEEEQDVSNVGQRKGITFSFWHAIISLVSVVIGVNVIICCYHLWKKRPPAEDIQTNESVITPYSFTTAGVTNFGAESPEQVRPFDFIQSLAGLPDHSPSYDGTPSGYIQPLHQADYPPTYGDTTSATVQQISRQLPAYEDDKQPPSYSEAITENYH